jgi:hypothetical protein
VFRQLVLARIIEPASQQDSLRVLEEIGRRRTYIRPPLVGLCHGLLAPQPAPRMPHSGLRPLVLCDVSTLYFETN